MEPNKKYYRYCQLTIIVILLFHIIACSGLEVCYDPEDFSTNSEYDSFVVSSSGKNCYYDQAKSYSENERNNSTEAKHE